MKKAFFQFILHSAVFFLISCGPGTPPSSDGGTATGPGVRFTIWGEDYVIQGIPAAMGTEAGFENGWTLRFSKLLVSVGALRVGTTGNPNAGFSGDFRVWNLVPVLMPTPIGEVRGLEARRYEQVSYRIAPATAATTAGNASTEDLTLMQRAGYSIYFEAEATHPMRGMFRLRWGFTNGTSFENCHDSNNMPGVVVPTTGTTDGQITFHADHFFYDDLQNPEARMRLDALVNADRDSNREVTLEELAMVDLTTLPRDQYGTGSLPNVFSLRDFVERLSSTVGHFNGEGHCQERR